MFSKENSRFLNLANVLLLGQVVIGALYFLYDLAQLIFPAGEFRVENAEWVRTLVMMAMGVVLLLVVNKRRGILAPSLTRAEKLFKVIALGVFDVAATVAASYLLTLPIEQTDLSVRAVLHSVVSATAVAAVFFAMLAVEPKLRLFREGFSRVLNGVILVIVIGFGWNLAWLLGTLVEGPDGASAVTQAVFFQQLFRFALTGVVLGAALWALVRNGARMSGFEAAQQMERRGQKVVQAQVSLENLELKEEIRGLQKEVAGLKKQLRTKKKKDNKK